MSGELFAKYQFGTMLITDRQAAKSRIGPSVSRIRDIPPIIGLPTPNNWNCREEWTILDYKTLSLDILIKPFMLEINLSSGVLWQL